MHSSYVTQVLMQDSSSRDQTFHVVFCNWSSVFQSCSTNTAELPNIQNLFHVWCFLSIITVSGLQTLYRHEKGITTQYVKGGQSFSRFMDCICSSRLHHQPILPFIILVFHARYPLFSRTQRQLARYWVSHKHLAMRCNTHWAQAMHWRRQFSFLNR